MADKKVSELDAITGADTAADDLFLIVDSSGAVSKKITRAELNNAIEQDVLAQVDITSANIDGGTIDNTPIGAATASTGSFTDLTVTGTVTGITQATGNELENVVEDTTPQLGGDLDTNGNDINFGDNDKAIFGAGSDFTIEHNGSKTKLSETGTGNLEVRGTNIDFLDGTGAEYYLQMAYNGAVTLYHDNAPKLATTSSGVDVTGTVTADEFVADSSGTLGDSQMMMDFSSPAGRLRVKNSSGSPAANMDFYTTDTGGNTRLRQRVGYGGDISFYADNGTSQGLFWQASTQNLGVGVTSPATTLHVKGGTNENVMIVDATGTAANYIFDVRDDGTSKFRVDPSGNVGIGTSGPAARMDIKSSGATSTALRVLRSNATANLHALTEISGHGRLSIYDGSENEDVRLDSNGISFLSGGLTFDGSTTAANALDDYEIGTFSPTLDLASNITSAAVDNYDYVKIGNLVHVTFTVSGSVTNASNAVVFRITVPFNGANNNDWHDVGVVSLVTGSGENRYGMGAITRGGTSFNQVNVYVQGNQVNATGTISTWLRGTLTYRAG